MTKYHFWNPNIILWMFSNINSISIQLAIDNNWTVPELVWTAIALQTNTMPMMCASCQRAVDNAENETSHLQQSTNPSSYRHRIRNYGKLAANLGKTTYITDATIKSPRLKINPNFTATNPHHNHKRLSPKSRVQLCRIQRELPTCGAKKSQKQ